MNDTKKGQIKKITIFAVMVCIFLYSAIVFQQSYIFNLTIVKIDRVTITAYLVGYIMTEMCVAIAIYEIAYSKKHTMSLWGVFVCMTVRLVFDIFTVLLDGFALPGLFSMKVFLVLDLLILVGVLVVIRNGNKKVNILLIVLTALYLLGEIAGYPTKTFDDIDEFVLMLSILVVVTLPLLSHNRTAIYY